MATVVIALISFAVAFLAGGLLSKAYLTVHGTGDAATAKRQLDDQRRRYRQRVDELQATIRRHEDAQEQIKKKLRDFQNSTREKAHGRENVRVEAAELREATDGLNDQLAIRDTEIKALRERIGPLQERLEAEQGKAEKADNECSLLRIERDELNARTRRLDSERADNDGTAAPRDQDQIDIVATLRADMGEMRESLATRDRQILDLELQIRDSEKQVRGLLAQLEAWKQRVSPLTTKLKQQRELIRKYRGNGATAVDDSDAPGDSSPEQDNLKKIRGIGPALERRLYRHGIRRFTQIAQLSDQDLAEIAAQLSIAPNLAQRDRWIEQARELIEISTAAT